MEQSRRNPGTPWWYQGPPVAVVLVTYGVVGSLIATVSESALAWAGGGLVAGLLAAVIQGAAKAAYDERQRHR